MGYEIRINPVFFKEIYEVMFNFNKTTERKSFIQIGQLWTNCNVLKHLIIIAMKIIIKIPIVMIKNNQRSLAPIQLITLYSTKHSLSCAAMHWSHPKEDIVLMFVTLNWTILH